MDDAFIFGDVPLGKWPWLPPAFASPEGIVGVGGDLSVETLLTAYRAGIFPWFNEDDPVIWWSPDPRAIVPFETFHVPKSLDRTLKRHPYRITRNAAFDDVVKGCAVRREEGTWVTADVIRSYGELHRAGHAHSLEVWQDRDLVGGIYGVAIGGFFAGESMFYREKDASKIALVSLVRYLQHRGFILFDTQILNDHTARFGAIEIPRSDYMARLERALLRTNVTFESSPAMR